MIDARSEGLVAAEAIGVQTILGAGGAIGNELMRALAGHTARVRLVRRQPTSPGAHAEVRTADLLDAGQVAEVLEGSDVAYLVAGVTYRAAAWEAEWPAIMRNVIGACEQQGVRLVFLDNVYLYGAVEGAMTEHTPVNPCSRKGEVRARTAHMLMEAVDAGRLQGLIARSASFYGPGATNTFVHPMVFERLRDRERAVWLCNDEAPHSMVYAPDAARALALLGNTSQAYGQVWHLPSHPDAPTGRQFIEMVAEAFGVSPRYRVLGSRALRLAGWFNGDARESLEMLYQYAKPYRFDSGKFVRRFFPPTPYQDAIGETAQCMARWGKPA